MKKIKELKIINVVVTLCLMLVSSAVLYAQDVAFASTACGSASSGTWTVPCDVTSITVEVYGGGGGAGGRWRW